MGQVNPNYPIKEVAISLESFPIESEHERKQEGDIVTIRDTHYCIGLKEMSRYLWLRIEGLEESEFDELVSVLVDDGITFDKRRYCILLEKLKEVDPNFDLDRARDLEDVYQPYLVIDEDTGIFLIAEEPFQVQGLIFDKSIGEYL